MLGELTSAMPTGTATGDLLLRATDIEKSFGGIRAVRGISLACAERERLAIIGPNGAGKSTLFGLLAGHLAPDAGTVEFQGERIEGIGSAVVCRKGLARTFQIPRPFGQLTVRENLMASAYLHHPRRRAALRYADELAERFGFAAHVETLAANLNVADQKRLELARAYATRPRLLLLDEVGAGLTEQELQGLADVVRELNLTDGIAIIFVEHVMSLVADLAQRVIVVDQGATLAEGSVEQVMADPLVVAAYLGETDADSH